MQKNELLYKIQFIALTTTVAVALCFVIIIGSWGNSSSDSLDFRKVIKEAKEKVFPAVVFIKCLRKTHEQGKEKVLESVGSGVLISADGKLLTNWHVVENASRVRCLLYDGRGFDAEVLGSDKDTDLALVKLNINADKETLGFAEFADSAALKEGDFVMAMGAPWGLSRSVSMGIISCGKRYLPLNSEYSLWLQTDAAISPGNSGGPLVNTEGKIVGINTRGVLFGGDMGFAIPSETIKLIMPQLEQFGKVNWTYTGIQLQPLKDFNKNIFFDADEGVIVAGTDPDSPADEAGLEPRDRILKINNISVTAATHEDLPDIRRMLGRLQKDKKVLLTLQRGSEVQEHYFTPREKGKVKGDELDCPRWDFTVKTINQFENPALYFYRKEGVFVYGIKVPGNAAQSGLVRKDIILKINGKEITSLKDVEEVHKEAMGNIEKKHRLLLFALRDGLQRQVVLDYSRDFEKF
ncbi:MAG: trypsin-like peptidase domain-containing protein [Planctomycetota bacterium]|jgi:serine protease Do